MLNPKYFIIKRQIQNRRIQQLIPKRTIVVLLPALVLFFGVIEFLQWQWFSDWNYWVLSLYVLIVFSIPGLIWKGIIWSYYRGLWAFRKGHWEEACTFFKQFESQCSRHTQLYHGIQFFFDMTNPFTYLSTVRFYLALSAHKQNHMEEALYWATLAVEADEQNIWAKNMIYTLQR
jgi:hypothetical protein